MAEHESVVSLASLQRFLTDVVRRAAPIADDEGLAARAGAIVLASAKGMSAVERLEVYREQFWLRHLPSLEEDYPTLCWAVGGRELFRQLAMDYLCSCPPSAWNLQELGSRLPGHVECHVSWCADTIVCGAARLDWAFMEAFDAADAPPFDPSVVVSAHEDAWPGARIMLHPSLRAISLSHPLHELRDAVRRGERIERPAARPTKVVVWRDVACSLRAVSVETLAFDLLLALQRGATLGEACEALVGGGGIADPSVIGPRVALWFQEWTANGWVTAVAFDRPIERAFRDGGGS